MNMDGEAAPKTQTGFGKLKFKQPSRRCVYIIIAVCFLCILCIILATTLGRKSKDRCPDGIHCDWSAMHPARFMQDERCESSCTTKPCLRSAGFALSRIDPSIDPCNDFYEFACGKYEEDAVIFRDSSDAALTYYEMENELLLKLKEIMDSIPEKPMNKISDPLTLAKKFFDDCMETDNHPDVLKSSGMDKLVGDDGIMSWPLLNESIPNDDMQLAKTMALSIFFDANPFFSLVSVGERGEKGDESYKLIFMFGDVDTNQLNNIPEQADNDIYLQYDYVIHRLLYESGVNETEISKVSNEIKIFEKNFKASALVAISTADEEKVPGYEDVPRFSKYDCKGLDYMLKSLKWCKVVEFLLENMDRPIDSKVELRFPGTMDYYQAVNNILSQARIEVITNYVVMKFIMDHLKYMPSPLRQIYYDNPELFPSDNFSPLTSRWQQCIDVVSPFFWYPLEAEYLENKFSESEEKRADFVLKKMKEIYISVVNRVPWIDDTTKKRLTDEIGALKLSLGNAFTWETGEAKFIAEDFSKVAHSEGKPILDAPPNTLIDDVLSLKTSLRTRSYSSTSAKSWMNAYTFNTATRRIGRTLRLSYGMLQFPMFLPGRPMYIEFATFGKQILSTLSTESILAQLPPNSKQMLDLHLKCFDYQQGVNGSKKESKQKEEKRMYGNFQHVLATLASTEAYLKYLQENDKEKGLPGLPFSNEQLFFIFLAQMNCETLSEERKKYHAEQYYMEPSQRVNVPLANSEDFSTAFRCPSGSTMNPRKKCCLHGDTESFKNCK